MWPECTFLEKIKKDSRKFDVERYIEDNIKGWNAHSEISIDGLSGGGKSTLINSLNRKYRKVNDAFIPITRGSDYNHDPLKAMSYLFTQLTSKPDQPICWDRSAYSNLIFYYVHLLMAHYASQDIDVTDLSTNYRILNLFAQDLHLTDTLNFLTNYKYIPILFIINSDITIAGMNLLKRGTLNDIYNAKEHNYIAAQCLVFKWFAEIIKCPCIDLNECNFSETFNLTNLHDLLRKKLNYDYTSHKVNHFESIVDSSNIDKTNDWINCTMSQMHKSNGLMYKYSNK